MVKRKAKKSSPSLLLKKKAPSRSSREGILKSKARRGGRSFKSSPFKMFFILLVWGLLVFAIGLLWISYDLPNITKLAEVPRRPTITILAADGRRVATTGDYYDQAIDARYLPRHILHAFLATEDRRFFEHQGVDFWGIGRAVIRNFSQGGVVQGGSTLTQQLAKNFLLTERLFTYQDRSWRRKIQEFLLSIWIEHKFSKYQILTMYLNRVYFGSGTFGIAAASRQYFNKSAQRLTVYEAALLAGVLKAPTKYSPLNDLEASKKRTIQVLTSMVEAGFLSQNVWRKALEEGSDLKLAAPPGNLLGRYFVDWILETAPHLIGPLEKDVIIKTTLNLDLQKQAEQDVSSLLQENEEKSHLHQAALVCLDLNGAVRVMVGGKSYRETQFNRAVQALRQTGSAFKLFIYLAALEKGFSPTDLISDQKIQIRGWSPKNYGWVSKGAVTLEESFAHSINTVSVRLAKSIGIFQIQKMGQRLGIRTPQPKDLTISLGTGEASLLEMTGAYAVIAREGYSVIPYGIISITTPSGRILYRYQSPTSKRLLTQNIIGHMRQMLAAVIRYGTGRNAMLAGIPCAGKTGTTQDHKDAWFIGFAGTYVTGVWMGNDDNTPMKKVTGGALPGKVWQKFMQTALTRHSKS